MLIKNGHGGKVHLLAEEMGVDPSRILDFSASINPLGPPPELIRELTSGMEPLIRNYPPAGAEYLLEALASSLDLNPGRVLAGNGSTELIHLLPRFKNKGRALIIEPAFSEYRAGLDSCGWEVEEYVCGEADCFAPDGKDLEDLSVKLGQGYDLVFLGRPANPGGSVTEAGTVLELARKQENHGYLVVDEAFIDFCPEESLIPRLDEFPALVILGSLTKFYGIPGLRLGYMAAEEKLIQGFRPIQPPWSVNILAQEAGRICLGLEDGFAEETRRLVDSERTRLSKGLAGLGLTVFPSRANYLLVRLGEDQGTAKELSQSISRELILIRDCANYRGLDKSFFRISVRLPRENDLLLEALGRIIQGL